MTVHCFNGHVGGLHCKFLPQKQNKKREVGTMSRGMVGKEIQTGEKPQREKVLWEVHCESHSLMTTQNRRGPKNHNN